ncbi:putative bifunctional diguanylate cyclase/phosphodiesterase [Sphingobium phenoxybenzoativorans]|uniref:putative bifunctional diguanylate cyclase/phosphodiesterase n=1 Tax=Sphingobium phenoxybenzoativorans TaxID=1592790 RepID=UPI0008722723|nr:EAL domain-containing protein [Sphingobium phenoxybenzoativorans]
MAEKRPYLTAHNDVLTGGIVLAATILFVSTGGSAISDVIKSLAGMGAGVEQLLTTALLLNVALILFGYRRYRDLKIEVRHRAAAEERAQQLAGTDPLTGFYNRRKFEEEGAALIARMQIKGKAVALMMLDLDHFKTVNDIHGHAAGDTMLKAVAERITAHVPPETISARLGGDEFACACAFEPGEPGEMESVADALVNAIMEPVTHQNGELSVSTSLGIARSDRDGDTMDTLLRRADIAMYAAKNAGRNRHFWFSGTMEDELFRRNAVEAGMRQGIAAGEFVPYYEQQVDLNTGKLLGFEMLARWESPALGLVAPDDFIPIAEETGMIGSLSFAVMRRAFTDARDWDPSLTLSVNISPSQLRDPWLSQKLLKLLTETGFPPSRLEIEITETSLYDNLGLAQTIIASLKNQGIRVALDDFGTGYSSLAHLRALPFDRIKIDRSFVTSMMGNAESAAIVQAITRLGDSLGLPVTAEGIESKDIEQRLLSLGLAKGQGWHFGKPMTVEAARSLLAAHKMLAAEEEALPLPDDAGTAKTAAPGR